MKRILVGVLSLLCCLGAATHAAEEKMVVADLSKIKVLDLRTAQSLALAGNPNMEAAQARVEQARARVSQAVATWWPSLDVSGSGARVRLSDSSYQGNQAARRPVGRDNRPDHRSVRCRRPGHLGVVRWFLPQFQGTAGRL